MANSLAIKGAAAELRWAWHKVATLGAWSVAGAPGSWTFTATIVDLDSFKVTQRPLKIVTPNGWQWAVATLEIAGMTLTASIRPQESEHVPIRETADRPPAA